MLELSESKSAGGKLFSVLAWVRAALAQLSHYGPGMCWDSRFSLKGSVLPEQGRRLWWLPSSVHRCLCPLDRREGGQAGLMCALVAGADAGGPIAGLGDQQSPPALSARAGGAAADSPSCLRHLPFNISPAKPGVSFSQATDGVVDLEPHAALRLGSQQQTKGCRRRKRKV